MDVSTAAPTVATMVGLGVGIDYALLLVTRHVEFLSAGFDVREAAGRAVATAGRSVVFASATVLVSLMGLRLAGLPVYSSFGFATGDRRRLRRMAAALTLVPALCRLAGRRLLPRKVRRGRASATGTPVTARWAARVGRRPLPWALAAALLLLVLAAPAFGDADLAAGRRAASPTTSPRARPTTWSPRSSAPGANGPLTFVVDRAEVPDDEVAALATVGRRASPTSPRCPRWSRPRTVRWRCSRRSRPSVRPTSAPGPRGRLARPTLPAGVELTGETPLFADIADMLRQPALAGGRVRGCCLGAAARPWCSARWSCPSRQRR